VAVAAALGGLSVGAPACGGSSPAAVRRPVAGADQTRADRLLLHLSDLPAGWSAAPFRPDPSQGSLDVQLADCLGLPSFRPFQTAQVHSDDFSPAGSGFPRVTSEVTTFTSDRYPHQDLAAFEGAELPSCAAAQYRKLITNAGQPAGDISVSPLPTQQIGDANRVAGFRARIAMSGTPSGQSLLVDVFAFVGPRLGATITLTNAAQPVAGTLEQELVALELSRVAG
jgi:hypothetical protein